MYDTEKKQWDQMQGVGLEEASTADLDGIIMKVNAHLSALHAMKVNSNGVCCVVGNSAQCTGLLVQARLLLREEQKEQDSCCIWYA